MTDFKRVVESHKPKNRVERWLREQLEHAVECSGYAEMENPMWGVDRVDCPRCGYIKHWLSQHPPGLRE